MVAESGAGSASTNQGTRACEPTKIDRPGPSRGRTNGIGEHDEAERAQPSHVEQDPPTEAGVPVSSSSGRSTEMTRRSAMASADSVAGQSLHLGVEVRRPASSIPHSAARGTVSSRTWSRNVVVAPTESIPQVRLDKNGIWDCAKPAGFSRWAVGIPTPRFRSRVYLRLNCNSIEHYARCSVSSRLDPGLAHQPTAGFLCHMAVGGHCGVHSLDLARSDLMELDERAGFPRSHRGHGTRRHSSPDHSRRSTCHGSLSWRMRSVRLSVGPSRRNLTGASSQMKSS
jgi:hypothetical protein